MNKWTMGLSGLVAAAAMLAVPMFSGAATDANGVPTGEKVPDFTAVDSNGKERSLSDFEGKTVILEWSNKDCPAVKKFYDDGHMQGWQKRYTAREDVVWLTVCSSAQGKQGHMTGEEWNQRIQETGMASTAVLIDEDGELGRMFAAKTTPHIYVIDGEGTLRYQGAIDSVRSTKAEDVEGATNYLVNAADAVLAGGEVSPNTTAPYGCSVHYAD